MAEHRVRKDDIIYTLPNDELFQMWKDGEAFIDDYGRLVNHKTHRVIKELKPSAIKRPVAQGKIVSPPPVRKFSPAEHLKDAVRYVACEVSEDFIDLATDKFFYEVLPGVWHEHIVPFYHTVKTALTAKELKVDAVQATTESCSVLSDQKRPTITMTKEESDAERRNLLCCWIGMLRSLYKLQAAGEIADMNAALAELTRPNLLQRVNCYLGENPKLLELDEYLSLRELIGRDLYQNKEYIPVKRIEIEQIVSAITNDNSDLGGIT